jgi:hypothetical protein
MELIVPTLCILTTLCRVRVAIGKGNGVSKGNGGGHPLLKRRWFVIFVYPLRTSACTCTCHMCMCMYGGLSWSQEPDMETECRTRRTQPRGGR